MGSIFSTLSYKEQDEILRYVKELVLKARQAGVFLILATQRPDADNFGGGVRDNLLFRVSLGKLSEQGYYMTFGSDQKEKRSSINELKAEATAIVVQEFLVNSMPHLFRKI